MWHDAVTVRTATVPLCDVQCAIRATSSLQLSVVTNLVHSPSPQPPKGTSGPKQQRKIKNALLSSCHLPHLTLTGRFKLEIDDQNVHHFIWQVGNAGVSALRVGSLYVWCVGYTHRTVLELLHVRAPVRYF